MYRSLMIFFHVLMKIFCTVEKKQWKNEISITSLVQETSNPPFSKHTPEN